MLGVVRLVPLLLVSAALLGGGCSTANGDGDRDGENARATYLHAVDRLCGNVDGRSGDLFEPPAGREVLPYLRRSAKLVERERQRHRQLKPPASLRAYHQRTLAEELRLLEQFRTAVAGIERGADPSAIATILGLDLARSAAQSSREARRLGLEKCVVP